MNRIFILEDSDATRNLIKESLQDEYHLTFATHLASGVMTATEQEFDLMLIDLTLPDGDGFTFCKELFKNLGRELPPFIFISGRYDIQDKLTGFSLGAEDYVVKPFDPKELKARVDIRLRRKKQGDPLLATAAAYELRIDVKGIKAFAVHSDRELDLGLTPNEFKVLQVLLTYPGRAMTRTELLQAGWGPGVHVLERTVDRHVSGLRRKLGDHSKYLQAIPGEGYRWLLKK